MTVTRLFRLLMGLIFVGILVWRYAPWPSRTLVFQEENCQCQIPYNWTLKKNPDFVIEAQRPGGGSFFIEVKPVPPSFRIDAPSFSQAIKDKLIADGHDILNESREPFEGQVAYAYTIHKVINGKLIYTHSVNFAAGKFRYQLLITKRDADPLDDVQLRKALDSFALITPSS